jgi:Domain of unknown function (DUF1844)
MSATEFPMPPATFEFLVFSLKTQAEMSLGLHAFGGSEDASGQEEPDLLSARHMIDMLAMLTEKTRGNLSLEEQRLIENSLTELRFRYVQVSESAGKKAAGETDEEKDKTQAGTSDAASVESGEPPADPPASS